MPVHEALQDAVALVKAIDGGSAQDAFDAAIARWSEALAAVGHEPTKPLVVH